MIKINIDNIDEYYELVNTKIDDYFQHNINPNSLKRYLKMGSSGMSRFIKKADLDDVKNIEKVIIDVVDDRVAKEELSITTFENFTPTEFNIKFDIEDAILSILSDKYRVSMGHFVTDRNHIKLTRVKSEKEIFVFTVKHLDNVYNQVSDKIYRQLNSDIMSFDALDIDIPLNNKIDREHFLVKTFMSIRSNINIIQKILSIKTGNYYEKSDLSDDDLIILEKKG